MHTWMCFVLWPAFFELLAAALVAPEWVFVEMEEHPWTTVAKGKIQEIHFDFGFVAWNSICTSYRRTTLIWLNIGCLESAVRPSGLAWPSGCAFRWTSRQGYWARWGEGYDGRGTSKGRRTPGCPAVLVVGADTWVRHISRTHSISIISIPSVRCSSHDLPCMYLLIELYRIL